MVEIEHRRHINMPADHVWEEIRHFDRVLNWIPGGETSTISVVGTGVGAVRDIHLSTQGYVQHRLVALDSEQRSFSYTLTDGKPIGMQDYTVVAKVVAVDDTHCTLTWSGQMTADASLDEEAVGHALEVALGNMTSGIIALLAKENPQFVSQPNEDWQLR